MTITGIYEEPIIAWRIETRWDLGRELFDCTTPVVLQAPPLHEYILRRPRRELFVPAFTFHPDEPIAGDAEALEWLQERYERELQAAVAYNQESAAPR